jgi:putative DNA primase/helicase
MGERFGLSPLIGKSLIVFADARLGNGREMNILVERLLNISGGDSLTIDRKNREAWTGRLPGRIVMASNEIPRLYDKAGALASRFIIIRMKFSAFGKEDVNLRQRLMNELPGIFNWAIEGLKRLQTRGKFVQPKTGVDALADLVALSSPISAFVRDRCIVVSGKTVTTTEIFAAWVKWCEETEYARPGNIQTFGRLLHSAVSGIETLQRRTPTTHERFFSGIGLIVSDE